MPTYNHKAMNNPVAERSRSNHKQKKEKPIQQTSLSISFIYFLKNPPDPTSLL